MRKRREDENVRRSEGKQIPTNLLTFSTSNLLPRPVTDEIATTRKDIDIYSGWVNRLENPDPVLRTEAAGRGLKLYDEVERDAHAGSVLQTRYLAVVGKEWIVEPADDAPAKGRKPVETQNQKIASFVEEALYNCNFDQFRQELLNAVLYGFYCAEVIWASKPVAGRQAWAPDRIVAKHPRRFSFTMDRELRLLTPQNMIEGEPVPDRKFIVFTYGDSDNPYGRGLGRSLWWPVWFKKNGIKFWMVFLDKFGMPTPVGKYPPGTPPEQQQALLDAIDAIQTDTGIKIPDTMVIELLEAARTGRGDFGAACEYFDKQISKRVLGQTGTTEGTPGKLGNEEAQADVRADILKADADALCECLNRTIVRWIVDYNFPCVSAYPKIWIRTEQEGDLKPLAERDQILVDMGVPIGKQYFYDTYGIPEPEEGEETVGGAKSVERGAESQPLEGRVPPRPSKFAEGDESPAATLDALGRKALESADLDAMISPVEALLGQASSLEELRDKILDLYGDMDASDLGNLMQQAFTLADLSGRFDARKR